MNRDQQISERQSQPNTSAGAWDLRHPGLIMTDGRPWPQVVGPTHRENRSRQERKRTRT